MKTYLVGYDLNKPGKDYEPLIKAIKDAYPTYWHNLDSTWIIKTDSSAMDILNGLKVHIDNSDELLVVRLQGAWASVGFGESGNKWLHGQMSYE